MHFSRKYLIGRQIKLGNELVFWQSEARTQKKTKDKHKTFVPARMIFAP